MEKIRLQKLLSDNGYCSRRKAEELIQKGAVIVNGKPAKLGDKANDKDVILVSGERIRMQSKRKKLYIMLNKPRGFVTTVSDEQGRRCVMDLVADIDERLYPVGRLDRNSEGLLLLTNDGAFANMITHPARHISKTYRVTVDSAVTEDQLTALCVGVTLDDGFKTQPCTAESILTSPERSVLRITIHEGHNRQVRRMCDAVGLNVVRLRRISVGPLKLGMLKPGTWRELKPDEIRALRTAAAK